MKKRFSVEKSDYSTNREDFYKKECYNLAFDNNHKLIIENDKVDLISNNEKLMDFKPLNNRCFWFEIYTSLKNFYIKKNTF